MEPDVWEGSRASSQAVVGDEVGRGACRGERGATATISTIDMHYLLATVDGVEHIEEVHRMGLFSADEYRAAFEAAGLRYERVDGLTGRGVHVGVRRDEG